MSPLYQRSPELDCILQMWPHQCWTQRKDHLPRPADNTSLKTALLAPVIWFIKLRFLPVLLLSASLLRVRSVPSLHPHHYWSYPTESDPSIDTWSIPVVTNLQLDFVPLIIMLLAQYFCQLKIHLTVHFWNPFLISLSMKMLQETVMKALLKLK